jgi:hypothetical protein
MCVPVQAALHARIDAACACDSRIAVARRSGSTRSTCMASRAALQLGDAKPPGGAPPRSSMSYRVRGHEAAPSPPPRSHARSRHAHSQGHRAHPRRRSRPGHGATAAGAPPVLAALTDVAPGRASASRNEPRGSTAQPGHHRPSRRSRDGARPAARETCASALVAPCQSASRRRAPSDFHEARPPPRLSRSP